MAFGWGSWQARVGSGHTVRVSRDMFLELYKSGACWRVTLRLASRIILRDDFKDAVYPETLMSREQVWALQERAVTWAESNLNWLRKNICK